jgi:hypothetical protein
MAHKALRSAYLSYRSIIFPLKSAAGGLISLFSHKVHSFSRSPAPRADRGQTKRSPSRGLCRRVTFYPTRLLLVPEILNPAEPCDCDLVGGRPSMRNVGQAPDAGVF